MKDVFHINIEQILIVCIQTQTYTGNPVKTYNNSSLNSARGQFLVILPDISYMSAAHDARDNIHVCLHIGGPSYHSLPHKVSGCAYTEAIWEQCQAMCDQI